MMVIPPVGPDGVRQTVNTALDTNEAVWHFRSGWNVAALNCNDPQFAPITTAYGEFLKHYSKRLAAANAAVEKKFRSEVSTRSEAIKAREAHMTQVYNYFATPAARTTFCAVALDIANESLAAPAEDLDLFAISSLARYEAAFEQFFKAYEQYRIDSAAWDAKWGPQYGSSQPGYVAVHAMYDPAQSVSADAAGLPPVVGEVPDPDTGAKIPVIAGPEAASTPVVQPVPQGQPAP